MRWNGNSKLPLDGNLVVHCKKQPYDVYIGRGSKWGNPFTHLPVSGTKATFQVATRDEAIGSYAAWLSTQPNLLAALPELKGKVLGCYCSPQSCHGDVLSRLANA